MVAIARRWMLAGMTATDTKGSHIGFLGQGGIGVIRGVEEIVPVGEHSPDIGLSLENSRQHDRLVNAKAGGAAVCGDGMQGAEVFQAGPGLPGPVQIGGLDHLGGRDQVGDLIFGATGGAPVLDVALGGRLEPVLDTADPGEVLTGRDGERLAGQPRGLADLAEPETEFPAGLGRRATRDGTHEVGWPYARRFRMPPGRHVQLGVRR